MHEEAVIEQSDRLERALEELRARAQELEKEIIERKKAQEVLGEYAEQLERSNKELDDFNYSISHDLKEPLRSLDAYAKFILKDYSEALGPEGQRYLQRIRANTRQMQQLIEDLLEISRLSQRPNVLQQVRIRELLEEVRQQFDDALQERHAQLLVPAELPTLLCDRVRLGEVFANLISNALKYTETPGCRIEIGGRPVDGAYEFSVRDHGKGIAPQYFETIFKIFQRLGKKEEQEGTGIGLAIVKRVIELHHGRIWVESTMGEGTTFHFTIPTDEAILRGQKQPGESSSTQKT